MPRWICFCSRSGPWAQPRPGSAQPGPGALGARVGGLLNSAECARPPALTGRGGQSSDTAGAWQEARPLSHAWGGGRAAPQACFLSSTSPSEKPRPRGLPEWEAGSPSLLGRLPAPMCSLPGAGTPFLGSQSVLFSDNCWKALPHLRPEAAPGASAPGQDLPGTVPALGPQSQLQAGGARGTRLPGLASLQRHHMGRFQGYALWTGLFIPGGNSRTLHVRADGHPAAPAQPRVSESPQTLTHGFETQSPG